MDSKALNYDKDAKIPDSSCYYSVFDGSYQTATGECDLNFKNKYQLPNPVT